jgi:plasmid stabilization system protein ParE
VVKPYRFLTEATYEFEEQVRYFDQQSPGLGDRFIEDVEAAVRVIREHPRSGAPVSANVRRSSVSSTSISTTWIRRTK